MLQLETRSELAHGLLFPHEKHRVAVRFSKSSSARIEHREHIIGGRFFKNPPSYFEHSLFPHYFHGEQLLRKPEFPGDTFGIVEEDYATVESFLRKAFKRNRTWYASDIAESLNMDYLKVREVIARMISEGKLSVNRS